MFVYLSAYIVIGGKKFLRVNQIEIVKDSKKIENTAIVKIPTTARVERLGNSVSEIETAKAFSPGDQISIWLGYNNELREEFRGFVRKVKPNTPLEIECDDEIYLLRRKNLKASFKSTTLRGLLEYILDGTGIRIIDNIPEIKFTRFYFKNVTAANALQDLKKKYGLTIYFQNWKELFVGLANENDGVEIKYGFGKNIIKSSLEWIDEKDVRLKVKAIAVKPNNERLTLELGDSDGEQRTIFFYNLESKSDLRAKAKDEIERIKYSGYKGHINTFLIPYCEIANVASITDNDFPERSGKYLIKKVTTSYSDGGARRKVELGIKVS